MLTKSPDRGRKREAGTDNGAVAAPPRRQNITVVVQWDATEPAGRRVHNDPAERRHRIDDIGDQMKPSRSFHTTTSKGATHQSAAHGAVRPRKSDRTSRQHDGDVPLR